MLGNLYYFFTLILVIFNILTIANILKFWQITNWMQSYKKVTGKFPEKEEFKPGEFELQSFIISNFVFNAFWIFLGILSKSWIIYLFLILVSSSMIFLSKIFDHFVGNNNIFSKIISLSLIIFVTGTFILLTINHHHLHLELGNMLLKYF